VIFILLQYTYEANFFLDHLTYGKLHTPPHLEKEYLWAERALCRTPWEPFGRLLPPKKET